MAMLLRLWILVNLFLVIIIVAVAANDCQWTGHHHRFGPNCEFQCHCRDRRERCDKETGNCTQTGCDEESIGPGCQLRNFAWKSEVDANYGSSLGHAVDGNHETCTSQSVLSANPFVRVSLPYETKVTEVFIRFKNYTEASGFAVYVGVSTSRDQRTLCGTDPKAQTQDLSLSVVCNKPLQGRFVTIYLGGLAKTLEICEIGIEKGRYLSYMKRMYGSSQDSNLNHAVNGRQDDHASTREQDNPWMYIDLLEEYEINMVDIVNKEDIRTDLIGFEVYLATKQDFSDAEMIYTDFSTTETVPVRIAISVPGKIARYVRITISGAKRRIQLREIWVLGGCLEKRCGYGCNKLCYCDNERMSAQGRIDGLCTGSCDRNWFNDNGRCNTSVCKNGLFGYECAYRCQCDDMCHPWTAMYLMDTDICVCQNGTFGYECAYQCQCDGMCHPWTGKCLMEMDICNKHYYGEHCQGSNSIRESMFTAQGNTSYTSAAMTVDGLLTTCGPILAGQAASWTVPLGVEKPVDQIVIQVNENTTGYGFEVITENAASFFQCDTFRQGVGDRYLARCRNVPATHVRLRTRSTVQICEVAVLECADGTFGDLCDRTCLCYNGRPCNKTTGACPAGGCESGYYGTLCDRECIAGTYGRNCERECGQCKDGAVCDIFTGECPGSCQAGWQGGRCDIECRNGTYGEDCIRDCGWCLDGEACNKATGDCPEGCGPGYFTKNCSVECVAGRYGYNCNETCGTCRNNQVCDSRDGYCRGGCVLGRMPPLCDADCDHGTYGEGCSQTCGDCRYNLTCDPITGVCQDGCDPGVFVDDFDPMCTPACADGYFGYNCTQQCYEDLCEGTSICNKSTGGCLKGCLYPGVEPPLCLDDCCDGSYGYGCALLCGMCKDRAPCNKTTGECPTGCNSGFVGSLCDTTEWSMQLSAASTAALVMGVVLAVLGLAAMGVAIWIWKRKKSSPREFDDTKKVEPPPIKPHLRNASLVSRVYENNITDYENVPTLERRSSKFLTTDSLGPKGTVSVEGLWDYIQKMKMNKSDLIQQFNDLATGLIHPCEAARKAQNIRKNRYKEIFPYDHTRVKLDVVPDDDGNDYINACYVSGYNRPHMYIAAQGPTEELVNDFWRMIWQKKCRKVVMLTRLVEHGKVKCCQYWPEEGGLQYGTVYVELKHTDLYADYNVRTFAVSNEDSPEAVEVKQYHFEAWPDRHVPDFSSSVIEFWGKVRAPEFKDNTPLLVHCSAGIGRTGTFLALDYLVDQANVEGYVNIQQCVQNLRHQRINMVQNQDQYIFLHDTLGEALLCPGSPVPCEKFAAQYKKMLDLDLVTREPKLKQEFEKLQHVTKMYGKSKTSFEDEVLKSPKFGLGGSLSEYDKGCTKPVFIPTYRENQRYLVTQTPAADTVVDFWQTVYEHGVTSIVNLDSNTNPTDVFLPALRETLTFMPFQLHLVSEEHHVTHIERTLTLLNAEMPREKSRQIKQFECKFWPDDNLVPPEDGAAALLTVHDDVMKWQVKSAPQKPILVHCMNGADKSGVYCVVTCAVDRVKEEREVALLQTVKHVRTRRHQVIPNYEQYKFCHDAMLEFLRSFDTYSNFFI